MKTKCVFLKLSGVKAFDNCNLPVKGKQHVIRAKSKSKSPHNKRYMSKLPTCKQYR